MRTLVAFAVGIAITSTAAAAPSKPAAKAAFKQGVVAYKQGNYAAASEALEKSYKLEADPDTLFAWAQAERKLGHCDRSIGMYERLLERDMPAANKAAITTNLTECKAVIAKADSTDDAARPKATSAPASVDTPAPTEEPTRVATIEAARAPTREMPARSEARPWWKDPVGDTLVVVGLVGVGVGGAMLMSARSLDAQASDINQTSNYFEFQQLRDRAHSRSEIGLVAGGVGAAAIIGGIVWYATRSNKPAPVVGWTGPHAGGLAVAGAW